MKSLTRLLLAATLAAGVVATATPATANDCSNPKNPCGGCSLNPNVLEDLAINDPELSDVIRCYPV